MVTLQPGVHVSRSSISSGNSSRDHESDPLIVNTPPDNGGPPIGLSGDSHKTRKVKLGSLRSRSPRLPSPVSPTFEFPCLSSVSQSKHASVAGTANKRVSPPALLIRSATSDGGMGSPTGTVDTVVTITDTDTVHVSLASPKLMAQLHQKQQARTPPDLRFDFFSEISKNRKQEKLCDDIGRAIVTSNDTPSSPIVAGSIYLPAASPTQHSSVVVTPASGSSLELPSSPSSNMKQPMQQLPDVANLLTLQELHDFEMKYGSPHHSRSQSVKTMKRPNFLCLPQQRSRVASMPNTGNEEEYYRLRHFSIAGKGIVNRGDSLKSRRSRSNTSVASSNSSHSTEHIGVGACLNAGSYPGSARTSASASLASSRESSTSGVGGNLLPYRVVMLGAAGAGKSSLISQFMTSEHQHAYDTSLDDEFGEKAVSVLLEGEESELTFIDHPTAEMSPENCITTYEPHAYAVVYSVADRSSFLLAEETLQFLWKSASVGTKAVILVANKTDLVRSRVVSTEEGKTMATSYDCKFIETSVAINHNVDELLVGILTQIRLKIQDPERSQKLLRKRSSRRKYRGARTTASLKVKGLLDKVWCRDSKSKSCENLHVL